MLQCLNGKATQEWKSLRSDEGCEKRLWDLLHIVDSRQGEHVWKSLNDNEGCTGEAIMDVCCTLLVLYGGNTCGSCCMLMVDVQGKHLWRRLHIVDDVQGTTCMEIAACR